MTPQQLKNIRKSWGYSQSEFAILLETPLRTYQDWEGGKGRIPGIMAVTLRLLKEREERITAEIIERRRVEILARYPNGITSARDTEMDE